MDTNSAKVRFDADGSTSHVLGIDLDTACGEHTAIDASAKDAMESAGKFAIQRFEQAHIHLEQFKSALTKGDVERFIDLTEAEALCLHAMMMTSNPRFVLIQPNTLAIIQKIQDFREQTKLPVCFSLDAGANVHLLYPLQERLSIMDFIQKKLTTHCQKGQYIEDQVGNGAKKI